MNGFSHKKQGFTLIELLTVIAILAILSAILVPTVGQFRTMAKKANDINNLRQIAQASSLYATQNGEWHVRPYEQIGSNGLIDRSDTGYTNDIYDVAGVLALGAGLNDMKIWTSQSDTQAISPGGLIVVKTTDSSSTTYSLNTAFTSSQSGGLSYDYVVGLNTGLPTTTPLAFSRKETLTDSQWDIDSIYGVSGGHIAFTGGNVTWYDTLTGKLVDGNGGVADSIDDALKNLPGLDDDDVEVRQNSDTSTPLD